MVQLWAASVVSAQASQLIQTVSDEHVLSSMFSSTVASWCDGSPPPSGAFPLPDWIRGILQRCPAGPDTAALMNTFQSLDGPTHSDSLYPLAQFDTHGHKNLTPLTSASLYALCRASPNRRVTHMLRARGKNTVTRMFIQIRFYMQNKNLVQKYLETSRCHSLSKTEQKRTFSEIFYSGLLDCLLQRQQTIISHRISKMNRVSRPWSHEGQSQKRLKWLKAAIINIFLITVGWIVGRIVMLNNKQRIITKLQLQKPFWGNINIWFHTNIICLCSICSSSLFLTSGSNEATVDPLTVQTSSCLQAKAKSAHALIRGRTHHQRLSATFTPGQEKQTIERQEGRSAILGGERSCSHPGS